MSFLRRWSYKLGKERVAALYIGAGILFFLFLLGLLFHWYQVPPEVQNPSLVLEALKPEKTVGEVWGFETYLGRRNAQALQLPLPKLKSLMTGLFAEKVLATSAWERPLGDIKYSFYVLRQEANQRNRTLTALLIDLKEAALRPSGQGLSLNASDTEALKSLREGELRGLTPDPLSRYRRLLEEAGDEALKIRLIAREAALKAQRPGNWAREDIEKLNAYDQKKELPFYLTLLVRELRQGAPMEGTDLGTGFRSLAVREQAEILTEYREALGLLAARNYSGFVGKVDAMVVKYPRKDFAPVLLYQAWSVLRNDLRDEDKAEKALFRLKKEYPASDLAYPEKFPELFSGAPASRIREMIPRGSGLEKVAGKFNLMRGFFRKIDTDLLVRIKRLAAGMTEGQRNEKVLTAPAIEDYLGNFLPVFMKKVLSSWRVGVDGEAIKVHLGVKLGFTNAVISGKGAIFVEGGVSSKVLRLKLGEIRLQGVPLPGLFLRQIESDFEKNLNSAGTPLEFLEARYSGEGITFLFRRKPDLVPEGISV